MHSYGEEDKREEKRCALGRIGEMEDNEEYEDEEVVVVEVEEKKRRKV